MKTELKRADGVHPFPQSRRDNVTAEPEIFSVLAAFFGRLAGRSEVTP